MRFGNDDGTRYVGHPYRVGHCPTCQHTEHAGRCQARITTFQHGQQVKDTQCDCIKGERPC